MVAIIINNEIKTYQSIPSSWGNILNYPKAGNQQHYDDGFRSVVFPSYNSETQKQGSIYFDEDNDVFTYELIDKTEAEIQQEIISASNSNKQQLIQQKIEEDIVSEAQEGDDTTALDNQDLFPMWENEFNYTVDFKCQDFNTENELKLYKCIQAHTSQSNWRPKDVPALFVLMAYPGEIPEWVQPAGGHDAYNIGDKVTHNGFEWTSLIHANVWEPSDAVPTLWEKGEAI